MGGVLFGLIVDLDVFKVSSYIVTNGGIFRWVQLVPTGLKNCEYEVPSWFAEEFQLRDVVAIMPF